MEEDAVGVRWGEGGLVGVVKVVGVGGASSEVVGVPGVRRMVAAGGTKVVVVRAGVGGEAWAVGAREEAETVAVAPGVVVSVGVEPEVMDLVSEAGEVEGTVAVVCSQR